MEGWQKNLAAASGVVLPIAGAAALVYCLLKEEHKDGATLKVANERIAELEAQERIGFSRVLTLESRVRELEEQGQHGLQGQTRSEPVPASPTSANVDSAEGLQQLQEQDTEEIRGQNADDALATAASAVAASGNSAGMGVEELLVILKEMAESQKGTIDRLRVISKTMAQDETLDAEFDKVYAMVSDVTTDPLEARGMSTNDIEGPLQRYQNDDRVLQTMEELLAPEVSQSEVAAAPAKDVSVAQIKEINEFQLQEVEEFIVRYKAIPDRSKYDVKKILAMVQATLDSKVLRKYGIGSGDLHSATVKHQALLSKDQSFIQSHHAMQSMMQGLFS